MLIFYYFNQNIGMLHLRSPRHFSIHAPSPVIDQVLYLEKNPSQQFTWLGEWSETGGRVADHHRPCQGGVEGGLGVRHCVTFVVTITSCIFGASSW